MKALAFNGKGGEYFKIWIVNVLLTIVTLGLYYPWAKVRTTRYFYGNTEYQGRTLDYHATGRQLLVGYIIGLVLVISYGVLSQLTPALSLILPLLLFVVAPWLIWRSLMFNARMTSFSNVRFSFEGGLGRAYLIYLWLPILIFLVFLLPVIASSTVSAYMFQNNFTQAMSGNENPVSLFVLPIITGIVGFVIALVLSVYIMVIRKKKEIEYTIGGLKFGQGEFSVNVTKKKLFMIYVKAALITLLVGGVFVAGFIALGFDLSGMNRYDLAYEMETNPIFITMFILIYAGFLIFSLFIGAYIYSRQRQYVYQNMLLDDKVCFKSTITAKGLFGTMITNMLLVIFTFGIGSSWAAVRMSRYVVTNTWIDDGNVNIDDYLTQKVKEQSAIGEEIGDAFDIDVGVGF
ncbi:YjgN family protein [Pasteurella atlantica]|uniref:YjgN family protein n=1 Tax=Pasteurellaceae TaxID=712 RepID=UPI00275AF733|nr:YjgN family protein [Pasteurella atlantica]MDP8033685.1 YjgN family protein [Pasteurella atlantica]MDP8035535.1 YjgN family protein [Pasteurella atlantica]MDP8037486.1 YjgN family protein [Pasteurella atlantica]MDP8047835.1 YjgN family protein [Pasteurella atlantica]MDP8049790.1 YjgN family protein [Pasteurella atlantica]